MWFPTEIYPKKVSDTLSRFLGIVGWRALQRRIVAVETEKRKSPILGEFLAEQHLIELELGRLLAHRRKTGRVPKKIPTRETYAALAFAAMLVGVHDRLSQKGKNVLAGRVRGRLKGNESLTALWHELTVAAHLMNVGWDVAFADLEGIARFDFLAEKDGLVVEVECKVASADQGRKIHRREFRRLATMVHNDLLNYIGTAPGVRLVHLEVDDRLPTTDSKIRETADALVSLVTSDNASISGLGFRAHAQVLDPGLCESSQERAVREFIENSVSYPNSHHTFIVGRGQGMCLLAATSRQRDQVLAYIYKQLKRAHEQFSGERAGVIWANVEDISPDEWSLLRENSGLQRMSSRYLNGASREHICSLAYSSMGEVVMGEVVRTRGHVSEIGPVLHYDNMQSPFYHESIPELF